MRTFSFLSSANFTTRISNRHIRHVPRRLSKKPENHFAWFHLYTKKFIWKLEMKTQTAQNPVYETDTSIQRLKIGQSWQKSSPGACDETSCGSPLPGRWLRCLPKMLLEAESVSEFSFRSSIDHWRQAMNIYDTSRIHRLDDMWRPEIRLRSSLYDFHAAAWRRNKMSHQTDSVQ